MKSLFLTAIAALVVAVMPVQAAEKPAIDKVANLSTSDKLSPADCEKAMADCKGKADEAKCMSDLEAKGCTKAR